MGVFSHVSETGPWYGLQRGHEREHALFHCRDADTTMKTKTTYTEIRHSGQPDVMGCAYSQLNLEIESSYVEDGELNVLVSPKVSPDEKPGDSEPRWTLITDPQTRKLLRVDFCIATDNGFKYPDYTPTPEQLGLFCNFVKAV